MYQKLQTAVKFAIVMFLMTIVCTILWEILASDLYDCTDPGLPGFLNPGNWVHVVGSQPVMTVHKIVHNRSMSEPDTIKKGWSVISLFCLWLEFFVTSLLVSIKLARKKWF